MKIWSRRIALGRFFYFFRSYFRQCNDFIFSFWNFLTFNLYPRIKICWLWLKHGGKFWINYLHGNSHGKPVVVTKYYSKAFSLFPTPGLCRLLTAWAWYSNVFYIHYLAPFLASGRHCAYKQGTAGWKLFWSLNLISMRLHFHNKDFKLHLISIR